ncbi:hypothetical protein ENSA5_52880 [Enhygromyxa salina]|uniref:Uncharacterized protein n=1 Tax=Enhygromyxa salina TaxID=215803 RepID=A0A2S9XFR1_9BACT|nr:DUF4350 domain-containing protein [Enhygromyxa salina]PRP91708.1 hypothetical protein ENSA5_52880 [Enhygromyxa salina]
MLGVSLYLAASLLAAEPASSAEASREVEEVFEQRRYYFCADDNSFVARPWDQRWCELAARTDYRHCRGFERVCAQDTEGSGADASGYAAGEGTEVGKTKPDRANPNARREREREQSLWELPDLGGFAKLLMWILLIGIGLGAVIAVAKNFVRDAERDEPEPEPEPDASESLIAARAEARRVVETDVQRLLARAELADKAGRHEDAINDVYAALLRRLEGGGLISVDRWKTNGDYVRALTSPLRGEVREIVRLVEQVQFGAASAEAGRYQTIRAQVVAIVTRAALAVALALGLGAQTACDPDERPDSSALAGLGTGPSGQRAVGELLLGFDIEARYRAGAIEQLSSTHGAIVLLAGAMLDKEDWELLLRWVEDDGGMLVVTNSLALPRSLGIESTRDSEQTPLALEHDGYDAYFDELEYAAPLGYTLEVRMSARGETDELLVRPGPDLWADTALTQLPSTERAPYVVRRQLGDEGGQVVVFADPYMLTNAALLVADNGAFLVNLFRSAEVDEVEFVNGYTGAGADDPFESVRNAKLGALFLQLLLFLAVLYAAVGVPFARLRDPQRQRRRSFAEHVRTLGQRYAQARAARYVAGLYSAWALDRLRERLLPGSARGLLPLAQAIAARTGRDEGRVMQTLVQAHELRETAGHSTRGGPGDLALMRELAQLLDETGGAR